MVEMALSLGRSCEQKYGQKAVLLSKHAEGVVKDET